MTFITVAKHLNVIKVLEVQTPWILKLFPIHVVLGKFASDF